MELYKIEELKINIRELAAEAFEAYINYQIPLSIEKYEEIVNSLKIYMK